MDDFSIDIIVPSYHLNKTVLLTITELKYPEPFTVTIYAVADDPSAVIPAGIQQLSEEGKIRLIINRQNLGAAAARNVGIHAGKSKWILFLDDDIQVDKNLLFAYCGAIQKESNAIGFAGVTNFPLPVNAATQALTINGTTDSFIQPKYQPLLTWSPTANVLLNRTKMDKNLFDASLVNAEDIDFLTRNSFLFKEKYIAVPEAIVHHPWWNKGKVQTKRMISYGAGASQIAQKQPIKNFTYRDFTNTSETILLLIPASPFFIFTGHTVAVVLAILAVIIAEYITNWIKSIIKGRTLSPLVALHLMWIKNCYEFAFLYTGLKSGYIKGFARRIDMGFTKPHPAPFRLNRWKIIKLLLLVSILLLFIAI